MVSIGEACYLVRVEGWTELVLTSFGGDPFCGRRALTVAFLAHQARLYLLTIDETAAPAPWSPPHHPYHPTTAAAQRQHARRRHRSAVDEALRAFWSGRDGHCTNEDEDDDVDRAAERAAAPPAIATSAATGPAAAATVAVALPGDAEDGRRGERCSSSSSETKRVTRASTYGEVTSRGARRLARLLGLGPSYGLGDDDDVRGDVGGSDDDDDGRDDDDAVPPRVFYDLGSGVGKLAVQVYLEHGGVTRSVGVEVCRKT